MTAQSIAAASPAGPSTAPDVVEQLPTWRGRMHRVAFFVAIPAGVALVLSAATGTARIAAIVYAVSLAGMFGASASYHTFPWSPAAKRRMKRLDHSMIYALIAGTYTPITLLLVSRPWSFVVISVVWAAALLGIGLKVFRIDGLHVVSGALYITMGWMAVIVLPAVTRAGAVPVALMLAGGVIYTGGAAILARRRPDPRPLVFGYHEVWHAMVVGAGACHYVMILLITLGAR